MYKVLSITGETLLHVTKAEATRLSKVLGTREPRRWDLPTGGFLILKNIAGIIPDDDMVQKLFDEADDTEAKNITNETGDNEPLEKGEAGMEDKGSLPVTTEPGHEMVCSECGGERRIVKKMTKAGATQYRPQCVDCMKVGKLVKKDDVPDPDSVPDQIVRPEKKPDMI